ncbi:MAG: DNA mismatch repair endonuclease MutL [Candidatus Thorarchaeota archaeon]|nr:MAG: DNA mismatch repair endonuclease MutL [Candidatus Thorarchaeota archaeon]
MGRVRVLSDDVISLISAGEVIENPSSVVKELVENSLDAGATSVEIAIQDGGKLSIGVSDNGSGIIKEDVPLSILRYSTSKLETKDDIDSITTYGFRGEALASIAAVATLKITTRASEEEVGTHLVSRVGEKPSISEKARTAGTTIEVSDLFSKVPARQKHLDDSRTEGRRVHTAVMRHAIVRPDVGFRLSRDGEIIMDCPAGQSAGDRVLSLWGSEVSKGLEDVDYSRDMIRVTGFIVKPPASRGNRGREFFSVIRRPIEDSRLSKAVEAAYSTLLMRGRFPIVCLDISLDVSRVDTNVHPAKREVRIANIDEVVDVVASAVKNALFATGEVVDTKDLTSFPGLAEEAASTRTFVESSETDRPIETRPALLEHLSLIEESDLELLSETLDIDILDGEFRIIGQFDKLFVLLEFGDDLVFIDQHAVHERILYERLKDRLDAGSVVVQELLEPIVLTLNPGDAERIVELSELLGKLGFEIGTFGGNEILVSALPDVLGRLASENELLSIIDRVLDLGEEMGVEDFMDEVVKTTACHSAIKAGMTLGPDEIRNLLVEMADTPNRYYCCHGRPSIAKIKRQTLDRRFGRTRPDAIDRYKSRHGIK